MAAPDSATTKDLNGAWYLNKTLSDNTGPTLALQGIGWLTRQAIGLAMITLHVKQYRSSDEAEAGAVHIDIEQTIVGGIKGTVEERILTWQWRDHADHIFGSVRARSRFVRAADVRAADGEIADAADREHLASGWDSAAADGQGEEEQQLIESVAESDTGGWTARQTWGFAQVLVGGAEERRHMRKVVVRKGSEAVRIKLVYDWLGKE